jgi:hypothetical protein
VRGGISGCSFPFDIALTHFPARCKTSPPRIDDRRMGALVIATVIRSDYSSLLRTLLSIATCRSPQREPDIKPVLLLDNLGRKAVAAIADLDHHRWFKRCATPTRLQSRKSKSRRSSRYSKRPPAFPASIFPALTSCLWQRATAAMLHALTISTPFWCRGTGW